MARGFAHKRKKAATKKDSEDAVFGDHSLDHVMDTPPNVCPRCNAGVNTVDPSIECDLCNCWFHAVCTEMKADTFDSLVNIVQETGWVCKECRRSARQTLCGIRASCAKLAEEVASLTASCSSLNKRMEQLEKETLTIPAAPVQMRKDVWTAVRDCERRRNNIIVTGLSPVTDIEDHIMFQTFCEEHFQCKPLLNTDKCRRIDKPQEGRIPRLLVSFVNSNTRDDILAQAKTLRFSQDPEVKAVYLNPDLSREEARLAYERRVERRASRQQPAAVSRAHPSLNPAASSFLPISSGTNQASP